MGSRTRVQSPSSVNKTSQWQLVCVFRHAHPALRCGYKRRSRANAQQLFVSELSLSANLQSVYKTNGVGVTARQQRLLSSADRLTDGVLQLSSVYVESALLPCSSARKAPPPGGVIHAFRPGPVRGGYVQRACSCGALDRAPAAVAYQLPRVTGSMACSAPLQNAATRESFTGPYGQYCDRCVHQPPRRSTHSSHVATRPPSTPLESETSRHSCPRRAQPCSRRALTSACPSGRMATPPRGTPADLQMLRGRSGGPVCLLGHVSLPAVFLPVRGDPLYRRAGTQLASGPTQICLSPSEPSRTDPVQGQGGRGAIPFSGALLAQSDLVPRTDAPRDSPSLANSSEEGSPFSERGHPLAPASRLVESPHMVPGWDTEVLGGLPPAVVNTITSARAPSTRHVYRLKWSLFIDWCSPRWEDPRRCQIAVVLLSALDPFEHLQSVELKFLSLKTVLLLALATVKRVGDLQAFSVNDSYLEFGPGNSHIVLRPRPGYVPKVYIRTAGWGARGETCTPTVIGLFC